MGTDQDQSHTQHVDAVLEPITPSSRYDYVEIEQEPIGFAQPFGLAPSAFARWSRVCRLFATRFWILIALVVALMVAVELTLRFIEPRLLNRVYNASLTGGHPIAMNEQGFRGEPVQIPKPEGTVRILALGDSVTMGTGIAPSDTWAAQLQARLDSPDQPIEVINTGLQALDLAQIELELRTRWTQLQPDRAVLVVSGNMISFAIAREDRDAVEPPNPKARAKTKPIAESGVKSKLMGVYKNVAIPNALLIGTEHFKYAIGLEDHRYDPGFPVGVMLAHGYVQDGSAPSRLEDAYELVRDQIATLQSTADELGLTMTVAYAPPRFSLDDSIGNNLKFVDRDRLGADPIGRIRDICSELGLVFIDPSDALRSAPAPVYVLSDYTHYAPSGHGAIAQAIAEELSSP